MKMNRVHSLDNRAKPPASQYINLRLHSDYLSDVTKVKDFGNTGVFPSTGYSIGGTLHTYADGFFSPDGTQENAFDDEAMQAFIDLESLVGIGGVLFMAQIGVSAHPASSFNTLFGGTHLTSAPYTGWSITHQSIGKIQFRYRTGGLNALIVEIGSPATDGSVHTYAVYIDLVPATPLAHVYLDGVEVGSGNALDPVAGPVKPERAFALFVNRSGDTTYAGGWGGNSQVAPAADIWCGRFERDAKAEGIVAAAVAEYAATPREPYLLSLSGK